MFKKVFAAMLAGLFISAPAFAEVKMSGSYFIKGNYVNDPDTGKDSRYYESDLEVKTSIIVDENTSVDITAEAFDTKWVDSNYISGGEANADGQNYFEVSKAAMTHKFTTGTTFIGGIDSNLDAWGTAFGDNAERMYFIQADQTTPFGTLTFKTEKINEGGSTTTDNADVDGYLLGLTMEAGAFTIQPALYYLDAQSAWTDDLGVQALSAGSSATKAQVAVNGKIGSINLESELGFASYDDDALNGYDGSVFGLWADASTTVAGLGINAGILYSGTDDQVAYYVGDELCPMEVLGDEVLIDGATLARVKVSKAITETVSVDTSLAYAMTNYDDDDKAARAKFDKGYEFDVNAYYKASDAVTLSTGVAILDGDDKNEDSFEDTGVWGYVKMNVAF
ncbi:hypothetical protein [Desulfoluna spongiiphila]|uniref:hypothetical protein n=1 Tax=Desulfoluna spongiiphila TaxID=419481 RepID=UPI0012557813|nr:hypothetical protein [Desulfoluna spongiiphila]VVS92827.1 hypothetical protein DBB_23950 [Desulfoluna spongiiphila]